MDFERKIDPQGLQILAGLPLLLNSSLEIKRVISVTLEQVKRAIQAEAATVYLLDESAETLTFWALEGGSMGQLEGKKMPAKKGVVGWVMKQRQSVLIDDAQSDPRFFKEFDQQSAFVTRTMLCVPLIVRGRDLIGAIQVLNKSEQGRFSQEELTFLEQLSHQVALALSNAKLHQAVLQRNHQLEVLDKRKSEVIQLIAHEFKTPLNVVLTSASLLGETRAQEPEFLTRTTETLTNGVQRLIKLIAQIKEMLYVSAEDLPHARSRLDAGALVKRVAEAFDEPLKKRRLALVVKEPSSLVQIEGDEVLLHIALRNLLSNAIRFTPDDGRIEISVRRGAGLVHFEVRDSGIGIEPAQVALIFEKFYEVGPILSHSSGGLEFKSCGLGLGLPAAQAIVKAHGATIEVQSTPGRGSTFSFALPLVEL